MSETEREGAVTLVQYALVTAGVADGIALEALLEYVAVSGNRWAEAELLWSKRMVADLAEGCRLTLELDTLQQEAREIWGRPIPPLDEDLKAWLDFQRGLAEQDDSPAYLESIPLRIGDLGMLQRLWSARMASEPQLAEQAATLLAQPAEPVTVPPPPLPSLPTQVSNVDGTGFLAALNDRDALGLPFAGNKDEVKIAPPLSVPLPKPPPAVDLDGTAWLGTFVAAGGLPFVAAGKAPSEAAPGQAESLEQVPAATAPTSTGLPASGAAATPPSSAPVSIVDETVFGVPATLQAPLPFDGNALVIAVDDSPADEVGETGFINLDALAARPLPFDPPKTEIVDETVMGVPAITKEPLPFQPGPAAVPEPTPDEPHDEAGETAFLDSSALNLGPAHPFDGEVPLEQQPLAGSGSLSLLQYAALETEIALTPAEAERAMAACGLDGAGRRTHAEALRQLFEREPQARELWSQARARYLAWRTSSSGGKTP
ncbi:MAG: hypothetical protein DRI90_10520 [Deltaproteobacteria bacterium]|nr:MAG: hypothetical protein DRI90_10520 [Deltaproteobacteria bacterium]